jgi:hypothetical protein
MTYRGLLITAAIVIAGALGVPIGSAIFDSYSKSPAPASRSANDFTQALRDQRPELFTSNNQPIFSVTRTRRVTDTWYLLQLSARDHGDLTRSYVLVHDPVRGAQYMEVTAGPDSAFSAAELRAAHVPDEVAQTTLKDMP